jgi:hypothetical protein
VSRDGFSSDCPDGEQHILRCIRCELPATGVGEAAARAPRLHWSEDAFEEQLREDAQALFAALCTGDGAHPEELDVSLITVAFRRLLAWAARAPRLAWWTELLAIIQTDQDDSACVTAVEAFVDRHNPAARAPRLEPSYLLRRAADALREWIQQDGWTDASVHNHVEYSKEVLAELEAARAPREPLEPSEAERALKSIATMLGWMNVPPQDSLEASIRALKAVAAARAGAEAPPARAEAFEKNGIRHGERVVCIDVPRLLGTVIRCATDGVDVRWDDGTLGELAWNDAVAYNAYRLQIVRAARAGTESAPICTRDPNTCRMAFCDFPRCLQEAATRDPQSSDVAARVSPPEAPQ